MSKFCIAYNQWEKGCVDSYWFDVSFFWHNKDEICLKFCVCIFDTCGISVKVVTEIITNISPPYVKQGSGHTPDYWAAHNSEILGSDP